MAEPAVLYAVKDHIAEITLNRPDNRNSMTEDVFQGLNEAVSQVKADRDLRCVIITGRGRSFCAGADFKAGVQRSGADGEFVTPNERSYAMYQPFLQVLDIEVPTIAAMQGHAIGGGLGLAIVCDIRVANVASKYGANFTRLGLHPGMASSYILPRLVGLPKALELLLTGRLVDGAEAAELGLANHAAEGEGVLEKAREIATEIAGAAPIAVRWAKKSIYRNVEWNPRDAAMIEAHAQSRTVETEDGREGIKALLEKRPPVFKGR